LAYLGYPSPLFFTDLLPIPTLLPVFWSPALTDLFPPFPQALSCYRASPDSSGDSPNRSSPPGPALLAQSSFFGWHPVCATSPIDWYYTVPLGNSHPLQSPTPSVLQLPPTCYIPSLLPAPAHQPHLDPLSLATPLTRLAPKPSLRPSDNSRVPSRAASKQHRAHTLSSMPTQHFPPPTEFEVHENSFGRRPRPSSPLLDWPFWWSVKHVFPLISGKSPRSPQKNYPWPFFLRPSANLLRFLRSPFLHLLALST